MRRDDTIARLKAAEPVIRSRGAGALCLYGAHARDEARPDLDVDVFIDKNPARPFGFDAFWTLISNCKRHSVPKWATPRVISLSRSIGPTSSAKRSGCFDGGVPAVYTSLMTMQVMPRHKAAS